MEAWYLNNAMLELQLRADPEPANETNSTEFWD